MKIVRIAAILLAVGLAFTFFCRQDKPTRMVAARAQIAAFRMALDAYKADTGEYPTSSDGLSALRIAPQNVKNWHGPYLSRDIPTDPWIRPYIYRYPGTHGAAPDLISYGADGKPGGAGINADTVSWEQK